MNLLIAIMGDPHEKGKETEEVQALHECADIIVDTERQHPGTMSCSRVKYAHRRRAEEYWAVPGYNVITLAL